MLFNPSELCGNTIARNERVRTWWSSIRLHDHGVTVTLTDKQEHGSGLSFEGTLEEARERALIRGKAITKDEKFVSVQYK